MYYDWETVLYFNFTVYWRMAVILTAFKHTLVYSPQPNTKSSGYQSH